MHLTYVCTTVAYLPICGPVFAQNLSNCCFELKCFSFAVWSIIITIIGIHCCCTCSRWCCLALCNRFHNFLLYWIGFLFCRFLAPGCTFVLCVFSQRAFWDMVCHRLSWYVDSYVRLWFSNQEFAFFDRAWFVEMISGMRFSSVGKKWEESAHNPWRVVWHCKQASP